MNVESIRPAEVDAHVRRVAQRIGCNNHGQRRAQQAAAVALRAGKTGLQAIRAGVYSAASDADILRRIHEAEHAPDRFWRDLFLDCMGLVGLLVIVGLLLLTMYAFMGKP